MQWSYSYNSLINLNLSAEDTFTLHLKSNRFDSTNIAKETSL